MQHLMEFAVDIASAAGSLVMARYRDTTLSVEHKQDDTPVTQADRQAELLLRERITAAFPDDGIVGEEGTDVPARSGRTWFLDPIDGTKSFVHGVPLFTTLVACHDGDGGLVGVIHAPALGETTVAGRGAGCFHHDAPARVSDTADLSSAYVMTSGLEWWPEDLIRRVCPSPFTLRTWGDGYGYSLIATGRCDGMVDPGVSAWDIAPMEVIISEAGGILTDLSGNQAAAAAASAVASNGHIHQALLDSLTG